MTSKPQPLSCPYCGQPLRMVPQRWFNRGCYQCDRCGDFPDLTVPDPARDAGDAMASSRAHIPPRTGRPRVLLVDDAKEQRDLYALMLEETATVVTASRGEDALAIAAETRLDAVIVDVLMPGMSGWEVCSRLKQSSATREVPVIILTSLDGTDAAAPAHRAGADAVLMKPCPVERLASTIEAVMRQPSAVDVEELPRVDARPPTPAPIPAATSRNAPGPGPSTRRWPRRQVAIPIPAQIGDVPVRLVNVSYFGLCLEIDTPPVPLPSSVDLICSALPTTVHADVVWRNQRDARTWLWGAEIPMATDDWCTLVDAQRIGGDQTIN